MRHDLRKFRYIRKNIASAKEVDSYGIITETTEYEVTLKTGESLIVAVEYCDGIGGGFLSIIMCPCRRVINTWLNYPPFFRLQSRLLARKLYYNY